MNYQGNAFTITNDASVKFNDEVVSTSNARFYGTDIHVDNPYMLEIAVITPYGFGHAIYSINRGDAIPLSEGLNQIHLPVDKEYVRVDANACDANSIYLLFDGHEYVFYAYTVE